MKLSQLLETGRAIVAPGVVDALTASIAQDAGFEALYLTGAGIAYTHLGRPDIGLVSVSEVAQKLSTICERVETPVIVDADTGYGNALNVQRTIRLFESMGAQAMQLEDQTFPKRCGHLADKSIIPAAEMAGKIRAAVDARRSADTLIIARTDAVQTDGFNAALDRAHLYAEAGADVLFVEAPRSTDQLARVGAELRGLRPLLANMVEGGDTPIHQASQLQELGFSLVIFPGGIVRAVALTAQDYYRSLALHGSNAPFVDRMFDFAGLNGLLGTSDLLAKGKSYEAAAADSDAVR